MCVHRRLTDKILGMKRRQHEIYYYESHNNMLYPWKDG